MTYPVRSVSRPAVLSGQRNGLLAASILTAVPGQAGGPDVALVAPAARAWRALCAAAASDGHVLKISHPNSAYRPYADQERIFRDRYTTSYLPGRPSKIWQGIRWWQRPGTAVAAVPGTSNHGWGLAVDTGEERDSDLAAEPLDDGTLRWLLEHEETFGWSHEVQSEPWHLRYFAGDTIPAAVLDHETGQPTPKEAPLMALTDKEQSELLDRVRMLTPFGGERINRSGVRVAEGGFVAHPTVRYAMDTLRGVQALDVPALAEELAARLPGTAGPVKVTDLEEALRNVLGSLDEDSSDGP